MPPDAATMLHRARHLRNNATDAERALWHALQSYGPRFTRQLRIDHYIADVACRRARLIVELDGSQHVDSAYDANRTKALEARGWRVIRFWNNEVMTNVEGVVEAILAAATPRLPPDETFATISPRDGRDRKPRSRGKKEEEEPPPTPPASAEGE